MRPFHEPQQSILPSNIPFKAPRVLPLDEPLDPTIGHGHGPAIEVVDLLPGGDDGAEPGEWIIEINEEEQADSEAPHHTQDEQSGWIECNSEELRLGDHIRLMLKAQSLASTFYYAHVQSVPVVTRHPRSGQNKTIEIEYERPTSDPNLLNVVQRIKPSIMAELYLIWRQRRPGEQNQAAHEPGEFEIEAIIGTKMAQGHRLYLVKWVDKPEAEATWLGSEQLCNATELIAKFHGQGQGSGRKRSLEPQEASVETMAAGATEPGAKRQRVE
jgi:hypothetical protein